MSQPILLHDDRFNAFKRGLLDEWAEREWDWKDQELWCVLKRCESPIEEYLATALFFHLPPRWDKFEFIRHPLPVDEWAERLLSTDGLWVAQQDRFEGFRLDFAIIASRGGKVRMVAVECDGHDFHEKTKEQAAKDKRRDRQLLAAGVPTLRFTGSEIFSDATKCAEEIAEYLRRELFPSGSA